MATPLTSIRVNAALLNANTRDAIAWATIDGVLPSTVVALLVHDLEFAGANGGTHPICLRGFRIDDWMSA
jgi:hypothetical protein